MTAMEVVMNGGDDNASNHDYDPHCCQACGRTTRRSMNENEPLLRCTGCKNTYYCSVECQRRDWIKGGHRQSCGNGKSQGVAKEDDIKYGPLKPPPRKRVTHRQAQDALKELCLMAQGTSVAESYKLSQRAKDEMSKEKELLQRRNEERIREQRIKKYRQEQQELKRRQKNGEEESLILKNSNTRRKDCVSSRSSTNNTDTHSSSELDRGSLPTILSMSYVVEEMPGIQQYQLRLWISTSNKEVDLNRLGVSVRKLTPSGTRSLVTVLVQHDEVESKHNDVGKARHDILFTGEFPRAIDVSRITLSETSTNLATKPDSTFIGSNVRDSTSHEQATLEGQHEVIIRLPFRAETDGRIDGVASTTEEGTQSGRHSSLDDVNSLVCAVCHLPVLLPTLSKATTDPVSSVSGNSNIIQSVKLLPKGHWDEIADYLICYSGEPIIDFTLAGTNTQRSIALEDDSTICFHVDDVGSSACVLAASDFHDVFDEDDVRRQSESKPIFKSNEQVDTDNQTSEQTPEPNSATAQVKANAVSGDSATIRGDRLWHDDTGEGGSVNLFCSQCCSAIGFSSLSSPETWRFWKHRLSVPTYTSISRPSFCRFSSTASFLVREMVRYAETKAIFTFVIHEKRVGSIGDLTHSSETKRCLLLRLLSWETIMACSLLKNDHFYSPSIESSNELRFRKVVKIVFEETVDRLSSESIIKESNGNNEDLTKWIWGGVDLCCIPNKSPSLSDKRQDHAQDPKQRTNTVKPTSAVPVSTVRLGLPTDEYEELKQNLEEGTMLLSKDVAKATILLQMGESRNGLKLTILSRF